MLTYYYSKGSSALAAHILLEEIGVDYTAIEVPIADGAHRQAAFLKINPKGRIPALSWNGQVITENPAILTFLAEHFPEFGLLPETPKDRARAHEINTYLCATVHVAFAHGRRGTRWADDPASLIAMRSKVSENLNAAAHMIEKHYLDGPFVLGRTYSICDPYMMLMPRWMDANGLDLGMFPKLAAHHACMLQRPATQRAMVMHGI